MRIIDVLEGDVIDFSTRQIRQKDGENLVKNDEFTIQSQIEMEDYIRDRLVQERDESIRKQKRFALPTIMSRYNRYVRPTFAWSIQLDDVLHSNARDNISMWIYNYGKDIIDELIDAAKEDRNRLESIKKEIVNVPYPDRLKEIVDRDIRDARQSVYLLSKFKKNTNKNL